MEHIKKFGSNPQVGILMGSASDWPTLQHCSKQLSALGIDHEAAVLSAHRTPAQAVEYTTTAASRGLKVIIASAGGSAHLAGVVAAHTILPVLGVPAKGWALDGMDSLLSTVNMPAGIPVMTLAIGKAGAKNAALGAAAILALSDPSLGEKLNAFRKDQEEQILATRLPDPEV